jgi:hypothetical protein
VVSAETEYRSGRATAELLRAPQGTTQGEKAQERYLEFEKSRKPGLGRHEGVSRARTWSAKATVVAMAVSLLLVRACETLSL